MKNADDIYSFLQSYSLEMKDENDQIIPFPECLSRVNSFIPDSNNLFSQQIPKETITFNELPSTDEDIDERNFLNSPFFIFNERAALLKKFCDLFEEAKDPETTTEKWFLISGNAAVGKSHFTSMLTLILRKYRKKFCLINIKNTAKYEISKIKYIMNEAVFWFYDEIRRFPILRLLFNIAFFLKSSLNESFLKDLLQLSIEKARQNNKTVIFLQDGINYSPEMKFLYDWLKIDFFSFIILITTSSDSKLDQLRNPNFGFKIFILEEMDQNKLNEDDKKKIVKTILKINNEDYIAFITSLFSCNFHILSKFKE